MAESRETSEIIAEQHGIGPATVRRAAAYARNVDAIADVFGDEARVALLSGEDNLTRDDVASIANLLSDAKDKGLTFDGLKQAIVRARILGSAKDIRLEKTAERRAENERLKQANPAPLVEGKYGTIVIDPPWDMQKIERDVRPNQVEFDYPTMSEEELAEFPVADMAADDCHLFCWTTQKYLPMTLRLFEAWGFRYVLTMVWHKPGGFQPIGLPQYNGEFAIYGRKGSPKFVDTKAFNCVFHAPRREHSRKPDEFYDVIRRVTDEGRIEVFSREPRDGFAQFGNEIAKFGSAS